MNESSRNIALLLGLGLFSSGASAFGVPFGVDPGAIGKAEGPFTASFIDFSYQATVDQSAGVGVGPGATSTFMEDAIGVFSTYQHPSLGNPVSSTITGLNSTYKLYALFSGDGTTTTNGSGGIDGQFNNFQLDIFADPDSDTTFTLPPVGTSGSVTVTPNGNDIHVATSTGLAMNTFRVFSGLANGDFDVVVNMVSVDTGIGSGEYFTAPWNMSLSLRVDFNGVNTSIQGFAPPPIAFAGGRISGSGNMSVPEPSVLAAFGIGLLGLFGATRKNKA